MDLSDDRVRAEEALRDAERRLRVAQEAAALGVHDYDIVNDQVHWDARVRGFWGLGPDEPVDFARFIAGVHPDDHAAVHAALARAYEPGGAHRYEVEYRVIERGAGTERWIAATGRVFFEDGRPVRLVGTAQDVTRRKQDELALRASEREFRAMFEVASVGKVQADAATGRLLRANAAFCAMLGYTEDELRARTIRDLTHPDDRAVDAERLARIVGGAAPYYAGEKRYLRADGRTVWARVDGNVIRDDAGRPQRIVAVVQDISAHRQAEEALRASEARYRALADNLPGGAVFVIDRALRYTVVAGQALAALGFGAAHFEGRTIAEANPLPAVEGYEHNVRGVLDGRSFEHRHVVRGRHFVSRGVPLRDAAGAVQAALVVSFDVTDLEAAQQSLREADRRKDEFLAMLAHELRNPLAPIRNAVRLLRLLGPRQPALDGARDMIDRQVAHLVRMVDDLLDASRFTRGKVQLARAPVDLRAVLRHAVDTSRPEVDARGQRLDVALPDAPVVVDGDFVRLTQVVCNLLNNAARYSAHGQRIALALEADAREARIVVADAGRGIDPAALPHLFDLFYQADRGIDRAEGGLGIGLALVRSVVDLHGGRVEAASAGRGQGARFVVHLPRVAAPDGGAAVADGAAAGAAPQPPLRVLVVDDNVDAAASLALLLRMAGHTVDEAYDGRQALEQAIATRPDVVLLDIGLPGLNGYEVCRALREAGLGAARIIAVTGYGQAEDRTEAAAAGFDARLVKPVDIDVLATLLGHVPAA